MRQDHEIKKKNQMIHTQKQQQRDSINITVEPINKMNDFTGFGGPPPELKGQLGDLSQLNATNPSLFHDESNLSPFY